MRYYYIFPLFCLSHLVFSENFQFKEKDKTNNSILSDSYVQSVINFSAIDSNDFLSANKTKNKKEIIITDLTKENLFDQIQNNFSGNSSRLDIGNVVINEFMASNDVTVSDQNGEYDDWLELYNNTSEVIDLSGYFLSDNPDNLAQWSFPEGTKIDANGFLIVWADGDEEQDGLHTSFKLSGSGESLILIDPLDMTIIDSINFKKQTTDISYAREVDGTGNFQSMNATFGTTNTTPMSIVKMDDLLLNIYPNPATQFFYIESKESANLKFAEVYDVNGTLIHQLSVLKNTYVNVADWKSGVYTIKIDNAYFKILIH